jgi:hypothetical protein
VDGQAPPLANEIGGASDFMLWGAASRGHLPQVPTRALPPRAAHRVKTTPREGERWGDSSRGHPRSRPVPYRPTRHTVLRLHRGDKAACATLATAHPCSPPAQRTRAGVTQHPGRGRAPRRPPAPPPPVLGRCGSGGGRGPTVGEGNLIDTGELSQVRQCVAEGVDVNVAQPGTGRTALIWAVLQDQVGAGRGGMVVREAGTPVGDKRGGRRQRHRR